MTKVPNATCKICGKKYHICKSCDENKYGSFETWKSYTDTPEHYQIFVMLRDFNLNLVTTKEVKAFLDKCDLSEIETFSPEIKDQIKAVLGTKETATTASTKEEKVK